MIAAGLCMMGGCFALEPDGMTVDAYWPSSSVEIPEAASSLAIYQYNEIPAGLQLADCYAITRQKVNQGLASFFYAFQDKTGTTTAINGYNAYLGESIYGRRCEIQYIINEKSTTLREPNVVSYPRNVEYSANVNGSWLNNLSGPGIVWNPDITSVRIRILDRRQGVKEFFVAHGFWGYKWYLLPMCSPLKTDAVFDFEAKTLVEI